MLKLFSELLKAQCKQKLFDTQQNYKKKLQFEKKSAQTNAVDVT